MQQNAGILGRFGSSVTCMTCACSGHQWCIAKCQHVGLKLTCCCVHMQAMNGSYGFSQPASAPQAAGNLGRQGQAMQAQQNGFTPQYAQQLQNHLLLQQSGAFPFLPPGARPFGPLISHRVFA